MAFVIAPPEPVSIAVAGTSGRFPVRSIWCVGRNYAEHAREMGHDPDRDPPFFFHKPLAAVAESGAVLPFPPMTGDLHHEIELVVAIGAGGRDIPAERALDHVFGYGAGLDMTRRDVQAEAKRLARPWDLGKGFDLSCPLGAIRPAAEGGHPANGAITLTVNGEVRQSGDLGQQIWSVPEIVAYLSRYVALGAGDLIMTGTPAGVGPCRPGDRLAGAIDGVGTVEVSYAAG